MEESSQLFKMPFDQLVYYVKCFVSTRHVLQEHGSHVIRFLVHDGLLFGKGQIVCLDTNLATNYRRSQLLRLTNKHPE